jgi:hypothetical protein
MKKFITILCFFLFCIFSAHLAASDIVVSAGVSATTEKPFNPFGEWDNKSNQYSVRYEGKRFGLRYDQSKGGDDNDNAYLTADVLARPFKYVIVGGGVMYAKDRLRTVGKQKNFHAMIGLENPSLFGSFGAGAWFDHDSNGHIHQIVGWDGVPNPPRNVVSVGLVVPF